MTPVLQWIKSHLLVVICSVVILAAPITSYIISNGMVDEARSELSSKASGHRDLKKHRTKSISLQVPGGETISLDTTPNPKLIEAFREAVGKIAGQSKEVHDAGLAHNREVDGRPRGADDLLPGHFPVPKGADPRRMFEEMPFRLHEALVASYAALLERVGAGMPPSADGITKRLERRRTVFVSGERKDSVSELDDTQLAGMRKELSDARLNIYRAAATGEDGGEPIRLYADESVLDIPPAPGGILPLGVMFDWQWRYWITQDILMALSEANGEEDVVSGPMKRLLSFSISPLGGQPAEAGAVAGRGGGGMGAPGMGAPGGGRPGRNAGGGGSAGNAGATAPGGAQLPAEPGKAQIDPAAEARLDPSISITGRVSNDVYDVRHVTCTIVVATQGLPRVLDSLSKRNFMSVLDLKVRPADPFAAARDGFIYGVEPVSTVDLRIETIWFREWTADAMPPDLRDMLGIRSQPTNAG